MVGRELIGRGHRANLGVLIIPYLSHIISVVCACMYIWYKSRS